MSALTVYQGLEERFRTISWLKNIILGEPTAAHELPCLYTAFESFENPLRAAPPADNLDGTTWVFVHRLMFRWQDTAVAELSLITKLPDIPNAIKADPKLGGRLTRGMAWITRGDAGFITIGKAKYRIVDYTSSTLEKVARSQL